MRKKSSRVRQLFTFFAKEQRRRWRRARSERFLGDDDDDEVLCSLARFLPAPRARQLKGPRAGNEPGRVASRMQMREEESAERCRRRENVSETVERTSPLRAASGSRAD
jgi:hypothetical protein